LLRTLRHYKIRNEQGQTLTPHGGIWLLELKKFNDNQVETENQRWLKFFREGERLNDEADIPHPCYPESAYK